MALRLDGSTILDDTQSTPAMLVLVLVLVLMLRVVRRRDCMKLTIFFRLLHPALCLAQDGREGGYPALMFAAWSGECSGTHCDGPTWHRPDLSTDGEKCDVAVWRCVVKCGI